MFKVSPASLKAYKDCPMRYKYVYIDGILDKYKTAKPEFTMGQHVHTALRKIFSDLPPEKRTPDEASKLLRSVWRSNRHGFKDRSEEQVYGERALIMMSTFFTSKFIHQPKLLEKYLELKINNDLILFGRIDRIDQDSSGACHLIDYKTGKYSAEYCDKSQLLLYSAIIRRGSELPLISASYWYLEPNQFVSYYPNESELDAIIDEVKRAVNRILNDKTHPPTPSKVCDWCEFASICPAKK